MANNLPDIVVLTNDPKPAKSEFIEVLHQAALHGQLGYMDGMDPDTGEIVPLLVGIERNGTSIAAYPLAHIFMEVSELKAYLSPDGNGNYINLSEHIRDANGDPITAPE